MGRNTKNNLPQAEVLSPEGASTGSEEPPTKEFVDSDSTGAKARDILKNVTGVVLEKDRLYSLGGLAHKLAASYESDFAGHDPYKLLATHGQNGGYARGTVIIPDPSEQAAQQ